MYTAKINDFKDDSMSTVVCQMIVCKISLVPSFGAQSIEMNTANCQMNSLSTVQYQHKYHLTRKKSQIEGTGISDATNGISKAPRNVMIGMKRRIGEL